MRLEVRTETGKLLGYMYGDPRAAYIITYVLVPSPQTWATAIPARSPTNEVLLPIGRRRDGTYAINAGTRTLEDMLKLRGFTPCP